MVLFLRLLNFELALLVLLGNGFNTDSEVFIITIYVLIEVQCVSARAWVHVY